MTILLQKSSRVALMSSMMLAFFGLVACEGNDSKPTMGAAPAPEVKIEVVAPQKVTFTTELAGRTSPFQIAEVRPQVSGIIQSRLFQEGSDVKQGDTLYQIDPATYQAQYDSAVASLDRAEANVVPTQLKMQRFKNLINTNAVSRQEFEDAQAAYKQAVAEVGIQKAAAENAKIRLAYTKVQAPISGRIGKSSITPGALVTENQAASLATVQQLDPMYVDVTQSSNELLRLRRAFAAGELQQNQAANAVVKLYFEDGTPYPHEGELQFTDVSVDPTTGVVTLRALFPNPEVELLPNMYVRAELTEGIDENAIIVSQRGIQRDNLGRAFAYVVNAENMVEQRAVTTSRTHGSNWVVTSGLQAGDRLIVEGLQRIRPGAPVRIVADTPPAQENTNPAAVPAS